jgi:uncharacterized protein YqgC (DUF456 family)
MEKFMLPCLFKLLFGIECLGCGFQRSLFLLFQGDILAALKMYPAIFSTLLFFAMGIIYLVKKSKKNRTILWTVALVNILFMTGGYFYKHFYL